ncbi:ABC transporter ATP-binding protein [Nitratireductor pacificus]|uniref:ABC transporter-like protein n=1 Tax=Nitratireductor pacificus pht-3B TaxID=391937 RepID=K2LRP8_9HYPH|nr:ABC transporter ATP-binding protein [Nitratireductor pacificus]EKF20454.1 ABC transporter-like protein [Nitratireductor pacificus pht-3B]
MNANATPAIAVQDVSKFFVSADGRRTRALDKVNLAVERGEFVSIIGPSGCGKTTMLKMVGGILDWDEGSISVMGAPVSGPGPERATVFQSFALLPWMTVLDNAAFGLKMRGETKAARHAKARNLLETVGLADFANAYPGELSGGMQQRVGLARALAVSPNVLLMDEPFSAIDAQTRLILQTELLDVWSQTDLSVLFITHAMDEAVFLSDRVVIMGARPGHVTDVIDIDLPRPRTEETRRDPRFVELTARVWDRLRGLMTDERAGAPS